MARTAVAAGEDRGRALRPWFAATLLGVAGAVVLLAAGGPAEDPRFAICLSRRLFHLPCPGCGMTRAFAALLGGDLARAWALHPWAPVLAAQVAAGWAAWGLAAARRATRWSGRLAGWLGPALLANTAALVALWLGRLATGTLP
jgi:hypothetical protein